MKRIILRKGRFIVEDTEFVSTGKEEIKVNEYMYWALLNAGLVAVDFSERDAEKELKKDDKKDDGKDAEKELKELKEENEELSKKVTKYTMEELEGKNFFQLQPLYVDRFGAKPTGMNLNQIKDKLTN